MAQGERLARASVSGVIRRAVCENVAVKSQDLANGRISVRACARARTCVHASGWDAVRRIWEVRGRRDLGTLGGLPPRVWGHKQRALPCGEEGLRGTAEPDAGAGDEAGMKL